MAHPAYLAEKARELRSDRRMTIDEIAARLALSRSTIYSWVADVTVPRSEFDPRPASAARRRATQAAKRRYRLLREAAYAEGEREYPARLREPTFRDFVCLYIGEGYKRDRNVVSLCNSDPAVVRLAQRWICELATNRIGYSMQYHADQDLDALLAFWGEHLAIESGAIALQRKSNSSQLSKRTWRSEHGVLTVRTGDTRFRARLQAWMDCLRASWP